MYPQSVFWGPYVSDYSNSWKGTILALSFRSNPINCYCMYICFACQFEIVKQNIFKPSYVLSKNMKNITIFHLKIIFFTNVKYCCLLHDRVFVMVPLHLVAWEMLFISLWYSLDLPLTIILAFMHVRITFKYHKNQVPELQCFLKVK